MSCVVGVKISFDPAQVSLPSVTTKSRRLVRNSTLSVPAPNVASTCEIVAAITLHCSALKGAALADPAAVETIPANNAVPNIWPSVALLETLLDILLHGTPQQSKMACINPNGGPGAPTAHAVTTRFRGPRGETQCPKVFHLTSSECMQRVQRSRTEITSLYSPRGERKYLNAEERRRVLAALSILPVERALFVSLLAWAGARPTEVLELTHASLRKASLRSAR